MELSTIKLLRESDTLSEADMAGKCHLENEGELLENIEELKKIWSIMPLEQWTFYKDHELFMLPEWSKLTRAKKAVRQAWRKVHGKKRRKKTAEKEQEDV